MFNLFSKNTKKQKVDRRALLAPFAPQEGIYDSLDDIVAKTGKSRQELLNTILADDEVHSCTEDIRAALIASNWNIWGDGVEEDFINHCYKLLDTHRETLANLAIYSFYYGFSVAELIFKEQNNLLLLDKLIIQDGDLDSFKPQLDGSLIYDAGSEPVILDQDLKFLHLRNQATASRPAGEMTILRAYPSVLLRNKSWAYAGQFIARYAQPYIIGKQSSYGDLEDLKDKLFALAGGGAAGISIDDEIDVKQLAADGGAFEMLEKIANARIQKLILGRVKTAELTNSSRAAQETEEETRLARIGAYQSLMRQAISKIIAAEIAANKLVFGKNLTQDRTIWVELEKEDNINIARAQRDQIYCSTGQVQLTKEYLTSIVGFEEEHIEMRDNTERSLQLAVKPPTPAKTADLSIEDLAKQYNDQINEILANSASYEEFKEIIEALEFGNAEFIARLLKDCACAHKAADVLSGEK